MSQIIWLKEPARKKPTLLVAFTGWNDAGDAASKALEWFCGRCETDLLATMDPEPFYDFSESQPKITITKDGSRTLSWPSNDLIAATMPAHHCLPSSSRKKPNTELALLIGTEPQLKWRTFTQEIVHIAKRLRSPLVVTLGALLADIPHTRPAPIFGSSPDPELAERLNLSRSRYEGPTGIIGVLNSACIEHGVPTASLWAAVPGYASELFSPKASLSLIENLGKILGISPDTFDLAVEATDYEKRVAELLPTSEETTEYIAKLEQTYDEANAQEGEIEQMRSSDPSTLVTQIEDFLRDQSS